MKTVWRVEHPEHDRHGPYWLAGAGLSEDRHLMEAYQEMYSRHCSDTIRHPNPSYDAGLEGEFWGRANLFGFRDAEQLCEWFSDEELVMLMDLGFQIVEVPAIDIRYGDKQVIFRRTENEMQRV
jgi:hypothetical protein